MSNNKFEKLSCSPLSDNDFDFTCYDKDDLNKLKDAYNKRHKDDPIKTNNPKEIWEFLRYKYHNVCNKESCWLRREFIPNKLGRELINSFAPTHPPSWLKNDRTWLSSSDIQDVMKQYERKYKCFEFIGPSPIDYYEKDSYSGNTEYVWPELVNFKLEDKIKHGKYKIGIIFNLDKHNQGGSHWVAMYLNLRNQYLYYFDSVKTTRDNPIPSEITKLVKCILKQGQNLNLSIHYDYNDKIVHQRKNTECGMYCLFFIITMLKEKQTWEQFLSKRLSDDEVHKCRNDYFNTSV